jgi:hypothetical protein
MKRGSLTGLVGLACLVPLMGCVVAPAGPPPPAYVAPAPVVVAPPPLVVVGPRHGRWYHGRRAYWRRHYRHR